MTDAEELAEFERACQAPDGQVWVCGACGKNGKDRMKIGDESCFLNAVLCFEGGPPWRAVPEAA